MRQTIRPTAASADFAVTLEPGDYGLICFVPGDGNGHLTHGMAQAVKVS
jgi:uncharacterized cupredoxin-like copper-binding protein